jgi:hypothetical protein
MSNIDPNDIEKFCKSTEEYFINSYALNPDRISDIAVQALSLHKRLTQAVTQIRLLNAEVIALRSKENA